MFFLNIQFKFDQELFQKVKQQITKIYRNITTPPHHSTLNKKVNYERDESALLVYLFNSLLMEPSTE